MNIIERWKRMDAEDRDHYSKTVLFPGLLIGTMISILVAAKGCESVNDRGLSDGKTPQSYTELYTQKGVPSGGEKQSIG